MELSERERRALANIERQLRESDPRFVTSIDRGWQVGPGWTTGGCVTVSVAASLTALLCLSLMLIGPAVVAALLAVVAFTLRPR